MPDSRGIMSLKGLNPDSPTSHAQNRICAFAECRFEAQPRRPVCAYHAYEIAEDFKEGVLEPLSTDEAEALRDLKAERVQARSLAMGTVYYLQLDEKIKIGWTSDLPQRRRSYPPHAKILIDEPGTRADERDLHRTFKPSRAAGREWYHPSPELMAHIERVRERVCPPITEDEYRKRSRRAQIAGRRLDEAIERGDPGVAHLADSNV